MSDKNLQQQNSMIQKIKSWKTTIIGMITIFATIFGWEKVTEVAPVAFDHVLGIITGVAGLILIFGIKEK